MAIAKTASRNTIAFKVAKMDEAVLDIQSTVLMGETTERSRLVF